MKREVIGKFRSWNIDWEVLAVVYPGHPGCYSGPPEKCYEAEPDEIELVKVCVAGSDVDLRHVLDSVIIESIENKIYEGEHP